jgi:transporter family protein
MSQGNIPRWLWHSLLAVLCFGAWGVVTKAAADSVPPFETQVLFTAGLLPAVAIALGSGRLRAGSQPGRGLLWGVATGLLGGVGNLAFFTALNAGGKASVVAALTSIYPVVSIVLGWIVLRERLHWVQTAGVVLALAAVFWLSWDASALDAGAGNGPPARRWMAYALVALLFWGGTGFTQKLSTNTASAELSLIGFAAASLVISLGILSVERLSWDFGSRAWTLAIAGGVLNGLGSLTSFFAYREGGKVTVVTPLVALYPVVTIGLAIVCLGEAIGPRDWLVIATALAAGAALSCERRQDPALH